ncbi:hypothetical protein BpHYR1_030802 [Brachionus plicatilis]|uniref:Uncharacterized protein n=1 Tax=Brachionus plicatilis TaxID=10195 RepID=A0A3M7R9Z4_BRAPC|nr:hypothetical protein BpHYR1_030802 [Brachionus plicatilis]
MEKKVYKQQTSVEIKKENHWNKKLMPNRIKKRAGKYKRSQHDWSQRNDCFINNSDSKHKKMPIKNIII